MTDQSIEYICVTIIILAMIAYGWWH